LEKCEGVKNCNIRITQEVSERLGNLPKKLKHVDVLVAGIEVLEEKQKKAYSNRPDGEVV
jgi:predicted DNA-binding protein